MSGFDITKQAQAATVEDEGTFVHIMGLDDKPMFYTDGDEDKPVGITVAGAHSKKYRFVDAQLRKRKLRAKDMTGQRVYEDTLERVAQCTLAWQGFYVDDTPVELTLHNARNVYDTCTWVLDQVSEAMQDHSRFFSKESSK